MLKKFVYWLTIIAILTLIFQGCSKPPPPPPTDPAEVDAAYEEAMEAKANLESLEKKRDMLNAELQEKQAKLDRAKACAEEN